MVMSFSISRYCIENLLVVKKLCRSELCPRHIQVVLFRFRLFFLQKNSVLYAIVFLYDIQAFIDTTSTHPYMLFCFLSTYCIYIYEGKLVDKEILCLPLNFPLAYHSTCRKFRRQRKNFPSCMSNERNTRFTFPGKTKESEAIMVLIYFERVTKQF